MKHYPYFVYDAVLLISFIVIIPAVSIWTNAIQFAIASPLLFMLVFIWNFQKIQDFRNSVKNVKGLSWKSKFLSIGTIIFSYNGQDIEYHSAIREKTGSHISVDYCASVKTRSRKNFEITNKGNEFFGDFIVSGDSKAITPVKKLVSDFNKKYMVSGISHKQGVLTVVINLRFLNEKAGPEKSAEMSEFLSDLLEFCISIRKKLK
ncbi:hypothetical protein JXA56_04520 [Candidatus Micrarchaeota archaeon]|nr:hypothetical protein [Candidatus Micrarchaeota archaeon]